MDDTCGSVNAIIKLRQLLRVAILHMSCYPHLQSLHQRLFVQDRQIQKEQVAVFSLLIDCIPIDTPRTELTA
jgi:hypothetical protein